MFARTHHPDGPWTLVAAENKRWARVTVIDTVVAALEDGLARNELAGTSVGA
jgi:polyphosphate kinase 2 (PPK2 family)